MIILISATLLLILSEPATLSLSKLPFLDESALGLLTLIALYFGYSRTFFIGLMLVIPATRALIVDALPVSEAWLDGSSTSLAIAASSTWLLWQHDKGYRIKNIALVLAQVFLITTSAFTIQLYILPPMINLPTELTQLMDEQKVTLSSFAIISATLVLLGLIRGLFKPNYINVSILTMVLGLVISASFSLFSEDGLLTGFHTILALLLTGGLLIESRQMAFRDQLTEIPSRMALQQYIGTLGSRYVVVMADIDHFKKFNDTHGHDIGDQVLRLVAKKIHDVSGGGKAFRYGGEEFTIVFTDKGVHQVMPFVEQVRTSIEHYPLILRSKNRPKKKPNKEAKSTHKKPSVEKKVYVTASFGVAQVEQKSQTFEHVMKQADNALYKAKKAGRNCVKAA
jgi:diguanylate cyclase (GGDEF)-like protein